MKCKISKSWSGQRCTGLVGQRTDGQNNHRLVALGVPSVGPDRSQTPTLLTHWLHILHVCIYFQLTNKPLTGHLNSSSFDFHFPSH